MKATKTQGLQTIRYSTIYIPQERVVVGKSDLQKIYQVEATTPDETAMLSKPDKYLTQNVTGQSTLMNMGPVAWHQSCLSHRRFMQ